MCSVGTCSSNKEHIYLHVYEKLKHTTSRVDNKEGECPTAYTRLMHEHVSAESNVPSYLCILIV